MSILNLDVCSLASSPTTPNVPPPAPELLYSTVYSLRLYDVYIHVAFIELLSIEISLATTSSPSTLVPSSSSSSSASKCMALIDPNWLSALLQFLLCPHVSFQHLFYIGAFIFLWTYIHILHCNYKTLLPRIQDLKFYSSNTFICLLIA